eukprot:CAMPEP_0168596500 /NCGR_PEP_ID=MMETSP0420-20121227/10053_1 /TAXON_ID=498008 /ORGANISM="Pessonella sp." /LENGTH=278 /DNA_ID=CAMNT_0008633067 /DNA_START=82 /DNA_END=918 /DNA_ORIENTATION=+
MVIRYEMPFNVWCLGCNNHIGRGVRYNAEKKCVGKYHSTRIFEFRMKCHLCDNYLVMQTDPEGRGFKCISGVRQKIETYDASDAEVIDVPTEEERMAIANDPFRSLERVVEDKQKAAKAAPRLQQLAVDRTVWNDDYSINRKLRRRLRGTKKDDARRLAAGRAIGINVPLLDRTPQDQAVAAAQDFSAPRTSAESNAALARQRIRAAPLLSTPARQRHRELQLARRARVDSSIFGINNTLSTTASSSSSSTSTTSTTSSLAKLAPTLTTTIRIKPKAK